MKTGRIILSLLVILGLSHCCFAQKSNYPDSLSVVFSFPEKSITDTGELIIKIEYKNNGRDTLRVLKELFEGPTEIAFCNFYVEVQVNVAENYQKLIEGSHDFAFGDSVPPPKFYMLPPGRTFEITFNLLDKNSYYEKGKYRFRVHLWKIPLDIYHVDVTEFLESKWFYFELPGELYRHR